MSYGDHFNRIGIVVLLLIGAAGSVSSTASFATAAERLLPGAALESAVGRFLLGETAPGLELMSRILGQQATAGDVDEFLSRIRGTSPSEASQLEAKISEIRSDLHRARVQRAGDEVRESDAFTSEERALLREVAAQELRIDARWSPPDPRAGEIRFTPPAAEGGLEANRSVFLTETDEKAIQLEETPGEQAPKVIEERAKRGMREWYDDSQTCLKNRADVAGRAAEWNYLAQQWLISGSITTAGYFAHTGISHFELGGFGLDLLMTFVSQGVGQMWMGRGDSFQVRWLKIFTWGQLRSRLDAEVYRISPWTDTHGIPMDEAAAERRDFNYTWNAENSWVSPVMYTVLSGVECLLDEQTGAKALARAARFRKGAFVFRSGVAVGSTMLYYKIRGDHVRANSNHGVPR